MHAHAHWTRPLPRGQCFFLFYVSKISSAQIYANEVPTGEIGVTEVRPNVHLLRPPVVPRVDTLLEKCNVFGVSQGRSLSRRTTRVRSELLWGVQKRDDGRKAGKSRFVNISLAIKSDVSAMSCREQCRVNSFQIQKFEGPLRGR